MSFDILLQRFAMGGSGDADVHGIGTGSLVFNHVIRRACLARYLTSEICARARTSRWQ